MSEVIVLVFHSNDPSTSGPQFSAVSVDAGKHLYYLCYLFEVYETVMRGTEPQDLLTGQRHFQQCQCDLCWLHTWGLSSTYNLFRFPLDYNQNETGSFSHYTSHIGSFLLQRILTKTTGDAGHKKPQLAAALLMHDSHLCMIHTCS